MSLSQADIRALVHQMLEATGLDASTLARRAGLVPSTLTRFLNNSDVKHKLSLTSLEKLSAASGVPILTGRPTKNSKAPAASPDVEPSISVPLRHEMPRDVPVFGTAMGANGDGAFLLNTGDAVDFVRRGPGIASNRRVFAIYVEGDSMAPRFEPGELVYVDKNRPIRSGDDVVLVVASRAAGEAPRAYLKRLVRRTADRWICEQFNPAKQIEFEVAALKEQFRVLRWQEVMGV